MKKIIAFAAAALAFATVNAQKTLKVAATPEPHADLLNLVKDDLKAEGIPDSCKRRSALASFVGSFGIAITDFFLKSLIEPTFFE